MTVTRTGASSLSAVVAGEVRAHLARRRISGRRAAAELGWTAPYLSRRLTGEIPFDVDDLDAIASLLDMPVVAFFLAPDADYARFGGGIKMKICPRRDLRLAA
jgi:transcriptional regulator with XRE-family HTH domain